MGTMGTMVLWLCLACFGTRDLLGEDRASDGVALAPSPDVSLDQLMVRRWTVDDGLPSDAVNQVLATTDGFLWVSSFAGLARFDGLSFTRFDRKVLPELRTDGFTSLLLDAEDRLWIGTQASGPWWVDNLTPRPLKSDGSVGGEIISMAFDAQGDLWVGEEESRLVRYRSGEATVVRMPPFDEVLVQSMLATSDGSLWLSARGRTLSRWKDGSYTHFAQRDGLRSNLHMSLAEDPDGSLWVGTVEGLARIRGETVEVMPALQGVEVRAMAFDDHGSLWLTTSQGLMRRVPGSEDFEVLRRGAGVSLDGLRAMAFDHEGSLWLGSIAQGLVRVRQGKFTNVGVAQDLPGRRVNTVFEDPEHGLLIGTDGGAFRRLENGRAEPWSLGGGLPEDSQVMDFYRDQDGNLWVSTYRGIVVHGIDGDRRLISQKDGLPSHGVRWVRQTRQGDLWVGTVDGFARRSEDGRFRSAVDELGGFANGLAFSLTEALDGNLLLGSREGLTVYSPEDGASTLYRAGEALPAGAVFNAFEDTKGTLWISTPGGLVRRSTQGVFSVLDSTSGLAKDSVFDYREDGSGNVWLSSVVGLVSLRKSDLEAYLDGDLQRLDFRLFNEQDGMVDEECLGARKMLVARDGGLWVPTLGGATYIHPEHYPVNPVPPPVLVTSLKADGVELAGEPQRVPAGSRRMSASFAALSLLAPERTRVRYRLEGFDPEWIEAETQRTVSYTNLPPGDFTLQVEAYNNDGLRNPQVAEAKFYVEPRFFQTWWFYGSLLGLAGLLVWIIHRWRMASVQVHNRQLTEDAVERSHLIEQLAAKNRELELFAYTASHDLKSPLVTIEGFLGLLEKDALAGDHGRVRKDLERIRGGVRTMSQLLDGLLEVSRIGRKDDTSELVGLTVLASRAAESLDAQIVASGAQVDVEKGLPTVLVSASRLIQVFQNLIANAIKYSGDQPPRIHVGSRRDGDQAVIYVRDEGLGVAPEHHQTVFGLFDRVHTDVEGSGLGLAIVQRIIEVHGGRVWVESEGDGKGATFCFTLGEQAIQGLG